MLQTFKGLILVWEVQGSLYRNNVLLLSAPLGKSFLSPSFSFRLRRQIATMQIIGIWLLAIHQVLFLDQPAEDHKDQRFLRYEASLFAGDTVDLEQVDNTEHEFLNVHALARRHQVACDQICEVLAVVPILVLKSQFYHRINPRHVQQTGPVPLGLMPLKL
jgi:hypothetical protein